MRRNEMPLLREFQQSWAISEYDDSRRKPHAHILPRHRSNAERSPGRGLGKSVRASDVATARLNALISCLPTSWRMDLASASEPDEPRLIAFGLFPGRSLLAPARAIHLNPGAPLSP